MNPVESTLHSPCPPFESLRANGCNVRLVLTASIRGCQPFVVRPNRSW
ncbi:MAG: hypothetical protein QOF51_4242 [Chloroflexota bacterium]|jgi:hypothetical protein|nr:hypothetical protein [Chloroflexota bacterium]